jgi:hypothetical protein
VTRFLRLALMAIFLDRRECQQLLNANDLFIFDGRR